MQILHLSDTHGHHRELTDLPAADVVVHTGDITMQGEAEEVADFVAWFASLPYRHKVFIGGNHDFCLAGCPSLPALLGLRALPDGVAYLCHSSVEIGGRLFYGVPMFRDSVDDTSYEAFYRLIPPSTDVLLTHQPPYGILDGGLYRGRPHHYGSRVLLDRVRAVAPRAHLFGHDHNVFGQLVQGSTLFANGALADAGCRLVRRPVVVTVG